MILTFIVIRWRMIILKRYKYSIKKSLVCVLLATFIGLSPTVSASAASAVNIPGVDNGMLNANYWIPEWERNLVLMDNAKIAALNQANYAFGPANLTELYFSEDTFDGNALKSSLAGFSDKTNLYLNGAPVPASFFASIRNNINGAKTTDLMQKGYGIIVNRTVMKDLPYSELLSDDPADPEWDDLVSTSLFINDPVLCYFTTEDKKFTYVQSELCSGWIPTEDVALEADKNNWYAATHPQAFLIVTGDQILTEPSAADEKHSSVRLTMGTRLELLTTPGIVDNRMSFYNYVVAIPERDANGNYVKTMALIPISRDVNVGYLPMTKANLLNQAFKSLGNRYGWGGSLNAQDCSSYVREVYSCFGLVLPRNTTWQSRMRCRLIDLSAMNTAEKENYLRMECPAGSIMQFPGHEMFYLGASGNDFYVLSDVSSLILSADGSNVLVKPRSVVVNGLKSTYRRNGKSWLENVDKVIIPWVEPW